MIIKLIPIKKIKGCVDLLIERDENDNKNLLHSMNDIGLLSPIAVKKTIEDTYEVVYGNRRLMAAQALNWETISCIVLDFENEHKYELAKVDENLMHKNLSKFQMAKLLAYRKEQYELAFPNSKKEFKSANNAKKHSDKENTEKTFNDYMANKMGCSAKTIHNYVKQYNSINGTNPELAKTIEHVDKRLNLKGVEIEKISKLSKEEMENLTNEIKEKIKNKEKFSIGSILNEDTNKIGENEKLNLLFMYDLYLTVKDDLRYSSLVEKIDINLKQAQKIKEQSNENFLNEFNFLFKNIS